MLGDFSAELAIPNLEFQDCIVISVANAGEVTGSGLPKHILGFEISDDHISRDIIIVSELSTIATVDPWMLRSTFDFEDDSDPMN